MKWETEMEQRFVKAEADGQFLKDRFGNPYTGSRKTRDPQAEGRNIMGKPPWTKWTKDELDKRAEARDRAEKIKAPIMARIRIQHSNILPDPA